ncbi:hypothetical protein Cadr_000004163 [Camelus dromedarius]|uniref:Uncharacterized protein n=1 Tax=Camelus dromedarius TaxID=9838 RepID=A0A5N4EB16_CAMDR|nr:hypothetical protein Cadr_000004163 [Camelus dromedarius]
MGGSRDCLDSILVPNGGSRSNTQFLEAGMTEKGAWCCGVGVEPAASFCCVGLATVPGSVATTLGSPMLLEIQ